MSRPQINFRVSEEEKSRWEKAAAKSKLPFGTWIKNALNSAAAGAPTPPKEIEFEKIDSPADAGGNSELPLDRSEARNQNRKGHAPKKAKTCDHGKPRGHYCGLCGGKAKVK